VNQFASAHLDEAEVHMSSVCGYPTQTPRLTNATSADPKKLAVQLEVAAWHISTRGPLSAVAFSTACTGDISSTRETRVASTVGTGVTGAWRREVHANSIGVAGVVGSAAAVLICIIQTSHHTCYSPMTSTFSSYNQAQHGLLLGPPALLCRSANATSE
jgi:hypothetical protein